MRGTSAKSVDGYVATVHDRLKTTLWEALVQLMAEAQWQKQYYDQKIGAVDLKPGLIEGWCFKGKRKIQDRWEDEVCEVVCQITTGIPS